MNSQKTVADPNDHYVSMTPLWLKSRAACSGERFVKEIDNFITVNNLLIPFSPTMSQDQYDFYKAEAEWPGITTQFSKILVGGLLRKIPSIAFSDKIPDEALEWIINEFGQDGAPLISFLDEAIYEEIQTSRAWIYVDYPMTTKGAKPYPVLWKAENVINWRVTEDQYGNAVIDTVIVRGFRDDYSRNEFHPDYIETVWVHELVDGKYQIRIFEEDIPKTKDVASGKHVDVKKQEGRIFTLVDTIENIKMNGVRLEFIPAWPLNGSVELTEPLLMPIIDKEVALYNKMSRRNHLLYGAATYTPIIKSDMLEEEFQKIIDRGLGSWIQLGKEDSADILKTPTEALDNMEKAIQASIEEIAKLGIRMLTPETNQSGVALQLRNASQTAQLGSLNSKTSAVLKQVIMTMLQWYYNIDLDNDDVKVELTKDLDPLPIGVEWLRIISEWYEKGYIPRSVWINILKQNDILAADYDDKEGQEEINDDELIFRKTEMDYAAKIKAGGTRLQAVK